MAEKKEKLILGIDDAGRGPVIGPMVLAGVLLSKADEAKLKQLGVRDSKLLSPRRREALAKEIKKIAKATNAIKISPREIDSRASVGLNLNQLEAVKAAAIVNKLAPKKAIKVIIDCPSVNRIAWKNYLLDYIRNKNIKLLCEHKADVRYPAVSAASIIAKVTRDKEIKLIQNKIPENIGSGYPADPITKKFLKHAGKYKKLYIVRETWQTKHKKSKGQKTLPEF